ncbi:hypothetical protein D3C77_502970 [compost metagenome]
MCAGSGTFGRVTEEPVLSPDDKGADGTLGCVVVDRQIAVLDVAFQFAPVAGQVADDLAQGILRRDLRLRFLYPVFQLSQQWQAALRAGSLTIFVVTVLQVALDNIELIDQVQRDVCPPGFTLGLYFLRFDELAPRMRPAAQPLHAVLCGQCVITGVVVGHDITAIAIQQAHGHLLRSAGCVVEKDHRAIRWAAGLYPHPGLAAGLTTRLFQPLHTCFITVDDPTVQRLSRIRFSNG